MKNFSFRSLFMALPEAGDSANQLLLSHQSQILSFLELLRRYGSIEAMNWKVGKQPTLNESLLSDLNDLYALSRVNEYLLLPFQPVAEVGDDWMGPIITLEEYRQFMLSLEFTEINQVEFHPFFHEIVEVEQTRDSNEPITILETFWPGFMLGTMLFSRAGIKVRGGVNHIRKEVAEQSTLYWTYIRRNRPVDDLSHGWGSNSQWRTTLRRDYHTETAFYYNIDEMSEEGTTTLPALYQEALTADERIELLRNRCFIKTTKPHQDLFPYNDFYIEQRD